MDKEQVIVILRQEELGRGVVSWGNYLKLSESKKIKQGKFDG